MLEFTDIKYLILFILNIFFLIIGFFLHSAAAIILVVPIVIPLIVAANIDPVHFGLMVTLNLAIGQQTPPVASVLIVACSIARANIWDVTQANLWFIAVLLTVLFLCTYVPVIPLFLLEYFYRSTFHERGTALRTARGDWRLHPHPAGGAHRTKLFPYIWGGG